MITASPFVPISRIIGPAASRAASVRMSTSSSAAKITRARSIPLFCATSSITEAIEPGPASIGIAMGNTETSSISGVAITFSARCSRRSVRFSNTMSIAMMNSMIPPATRKLSRSMWRKLSSASPNIAKKIRIAPAMTIARTAIERRCAALASAVRLA